MLALACGDDGALADESSSSSSSSSSTSSSTSPTSSSSGQLDTSESSNGSSTDASSEESSSSSGTTGDEPAVPVRAVLLGDPLGDGSLWSYLAESDGVTVNDPVLVHGPAPEGGDIGVSLLSSSLVLTRTETADFTRTYALVDLSGATPSEPAPVVVAPAPTGHVVQLHALANDELVFASAAAVDAAADVWSTSYVGTTVAVPERLSPHAPGHGYLAIATSPGEDAVLGLRTELASGSEDLVWMPRVPADPEASVVVTALDQQWQHLHQLGFLADAEHVWFTATLDDKTHEELYVDDLDPGTPPVRVNPALVGEQFIDALWLSPDRSTFLFWRGIIGDGTQGDIFLVPVEGGVVGTPVDITPDDDITHWNVAVSPQWRWVAYRVGSTPEELHVEIVSIADGVAGTPLVLENAHSVNDLAFVVEDDAIFYVDNDHVLRRATLGDELGPMETVSETPAAGFPLPTPSGGWLGFLGYDEGAHDYAHYAVDLGGAFPATTLRIDVPPEPGASAGTSIGFTADETYAYYTEFLDLDTPRALRATRLVEGGNTLLLGHTFLGYAILPPR